MSSSSTRADGTADGNSVGTAEGNPDGTGGGRRDRGGSGGSAQRSDDGGTRRRVLDAAMDLFGRQGYRATTIAQIEQAAGLAPGAGGLYRHFPSKRALLEAGLRRQFDAGHELAELLDPSQLDPAALSRGDAVAPLVAVARAGLRRLEQERDLNRVLVRDLADFPDLLAEVRDRELRRVHGALVAWLRTSPAVLRGETDSDIDALAAVLMGAVSHFWIMRDVFGGEHPLGIDEERYLTTLAALAARSAP
jgi:AcrR family transcriptional regulator